MIRRNSFVLLLLLFLLVCNGYAQVSVELLDAPGEVLVFTPVYMTWVVKNQGNDPVLLCNSSAGGWRTLWGDKNEILSLTGSRNSDSVIWLGPGEMHYFRTAKGLMPSDMLTEAGTYEIRTIIHGTGECHFQPQPTDAFTPEKLSSDLSSSSYKSWQGEVRSTIHRLTVSEPSRSDDVEALMYLKSIIGGTIHSAVYSKAFPYLREHYPLSTYTFVAAWHEGKLEEMLKLQPESYLVPEARLHLIGDYYYMKKKLPEDMLLDLPEPLRKYVAYVYRSPELSGRRGIK